MLQNKWFSVYKQRFHQSYSQSHFILEIIAKINADNS